MCLKPFDRHIHVRPVNPILFGWMLTPQVDIPETEPFHLYFGGVKQFTHLFFGLWFLAGRREDTFEIAPSRLRDKCECSVGD